VEAQSSPNTTEAHHILLEPSHQDGIPGPLYMGSLVTKPVQAWGNLQNLIGGSQLIHKA
jgi:hypothetical protein